MKIGLVTSFFLALACQALSQTTSLYDGARSINDQKIALRGLGGGGIVETNETAFQGTKSVRVTSHNFFQGGTMSFANAPDFGNKFDDKSNVLRVTFFLADSGWVIGKDDKKKNDAEANTGVTATFHAISMNHSKPGDLNIKKSIPFHPQIKKIRMVVETTDGKKSEAYIPVFNSISAGDGWRLAAIPLQSIQGLDRTNKTIRSLTLSTDTYSTMYVGEVRLVSDTTPLRGQIENSPLNLKWGSEVTLNATGEGGDSPVVYSWDFDDRDGIQSDASGQTVKYKFRKAGDFKVTLTVSDPYGMKTPVHQTLQVKVAQR